MANDGEHGNGLCYGFLKKRQNVRVSKVQVGSKIVDFLENRSCSVDFPQEIAFNHLATAN